MTTSKEEQHTVIAVDTKKELAPEPSLNVVAEEIQAQLAVINTNKEQDSLKKIIITKELFEKIKKSLAETVKSMEKNPSLFSRAAEFWGTLPLWQKILGGATLTLPTLILGIVTNIGFLLAICGVTAVTYTAGGVILDDHHRCSSNTIESLQQGVLSLADLLELTITALDVIREQLAEEIEKFVRENAQLLEHINTLRQKIDALDLQVQSMTKINTELGETKENLVKTVGSLQDNVAQQSGLLVQTQQEVTRITEAYALNQSELEHTVSALSKDKSDLGKEIAQLKLFIQTLQASLSDFSIAVLGDSEQKRAFKEKLEAFISNKEASYHQLVDRFCEAEQKLAAKEKEYAELNEEHRQLLNIQRQHIDRISGLGPQPAETPVKSVVVGQAQALSQNGIYKVKARDSEDAEILETTHELTQTL